MDNKNNELEILDELLKYMLTTACCNYVSIRNDTIKNHSFLKDIDNPTLNAALLKLAKDGYLNEIIDISGTNYDISFEGIMFIKSEGYTNQNRQNHIKENENADLKSEQNRQAKVLVALNRWLVFLTWIIALGTLIAAIYYLLEVLAFLGVCQSKKT
jgi:hypothetical protein